MQFIRKDSSKDVDDETLYSNELLRESFMIAIVFRAEGGILLLLFFFFFGKKEDEKKIRSL